MAGAQDKTPTDRERDDARGGGGDMFELLEAFRDVTRAELTHNPVHPAAPLKGRLLEVLDRMVPPAAPAPADSAPARRTR